MRFFGIGRAKSIEITLESRDGPAHETHVGGCDAYDHVDPGPYALCCGASCPRHARPGTGRDRARIAVAVCRTTARPVRTNRQIWWLAALGHDGAVSRRSALSPPAPVMDCPARDGGRRRRRRR